MIGSVNIALSNGKKIDHLGIKVEMIGLIGIPLLFPSSNHHDLLELFADRGNSVKFSTLVRELEAPGNLTASKVSRVQLRIES